MFPDSRDDFEFNDLQSIIIATSLPVRNEFIPLTTNQPVLTDYVVPVEQFGQQNQRIFYFPFIIKPRIN